MLHACNLRVCCQCILPCHSLRELHFLTCTLYIYSLHHHFRLYHSPWHFHQHDASLFSIVEIEFGPWYLSRTYASRTYLTNANFDVILLASVWFKYTEKKSIFSWQDWSNLVPDLRLSFHFAFVRPNLFHCLYYIFAWCVFVLKNLFHKLCP